MCVSSMRGPLLERMPAFERSRLRVSQDAVAATAALANGVHTPSEVTSVTSNINNNNESNALLDLLGGISDSDDVSVTVLETSATKSSSGLLSGLTLPTAPAPGAALNADILDLLGGIDATGLSAPAVNNGLASIDATTVNTPINNILDGLLNNSNNFSTTTLTNNAINASTSINNSISDSLITSSKYQSQNVFMIIFYFLKKLKSVLNYGDLGLSTPKG